MRQKLVTVKRQVEDEFKHALIRTEIDALDIEVTYDSTNKNKQWFTIVTQGFSKLDISRLREQGYYFTSARVALWRKDSTFELGLSTEDIFLGEVIA